MPRSAEDLVERAPHTGVVVHNQDSRLVSRRHPVSSRLAIGQQSILETIVRN
jgi:hypothetical protein